MFAAGDSTQMAQEHDQHMLTGGLAQGEGLASGGLERKIGRWITCGKGHGFSS
jgi:hypothetical protein